MRSQSVGGEELVLCYRVMWFNYKINQCNIRHDGFVLGAALYSTSGEIDHVVCVVSPSDVVDLYLDISEQTAGSGLMFYSGEYIHQVGLGTNRRVTDLCYNQLLDKMNYVAFQSLHLPQEINIHTIQSKFSSDEWTGLERSRVLTDSTASVLEYENHSRRGHVTMNVSFVSGEKETVCAFVTSFVNK